MLWTPASKRRWGAMHVTTVGRRSGERRSVILGYIDDDGSPVVLAMNGWDEGLPAWWHNLEARPDAVIRLKGQPLRRARVRVAEGVERDRLWRRWADIDEGLDAYAASRSAEVVLADTATAGMPASVKRRAMYSACSMLTQNPSARIRRGSSTLSRTAASTFVVRASSPV